jgi:HAD superfamily hydrolase (TIGR01509 family)
MRIACERNRASSASRRGSEAPASLAEARSLWICDVNGVLVDSSAIVREAFAATAARYGFTPSANAVGAIKGLGLLDAYHRLDPGGDVHIRRAFHLRYVRERVGELRAFPRVRETLSAARAAGIRIGAATSHGEIAEACLVSTGLYALLDCLVTQEEVRRPKPHPDGILRVLTLLGDGLHDPRSTAIHIGDLAEDVQAGKAAGIGTIGVTYGLAAESEIRAAEPDYVIHAFDEMHAWIAESKSQALCHAILESQSIPPNLESST